jgi:3-deoxy-manno-octulosonate cytidylyltransferase (CMP-KDO synthetase)
VLTKQQDSYDYVVNIQGDEPFIAPEQIDLLASLLDGTTELATLIKVIEQEDQLFNPNVVRVVTNNRQEAVYFTRATIPYLRNIPPHEWLSNYTFYKHIGMYAYRADILQEITKLEQSSLEKAESLEQLRWVENGYRIKVGITQTETMGIDTPEDLERALTHVRGY